MDNPDADGRGDAAGLASVRKVYRGADTGVVALVGVTIGFRPGQFHRRHGAIRVRQHHPRGRGGADPADLAIARELQRRRQRLADALRPPWIYPAVIGTAVVLVLTATLLHLASAPVPSRRSRRTDLTGH